MTSLQCLDMLLKRRSPGWDLLPHQAQSTHQLLDGLGANLPMVKRPRHDVPHVLNWIKVWRMGGSVHNINICVQQKLLTLLQPIDSLIIQSMLLTHCQTRQCYSRAFSTACPESVTSVTQAFICEERTAPVVNFLILVFSSKRQTSCKVLDFKHISHLWLSGLHTPS